MCLHSGTAGRHLTKEGFTVTFHLSKVPEKRVKESLTCRPGELGGFPRRLCSGGRPLLPLALLLRGREPGVRRTGAAQPPSAHARTHLGELPEVPQDDVCRLRADNCGGASFRWAGMGVGLQAWVGTLLTPVHALVGRGARAVVRGEVGWRLRDLRLFGMGVGQESRGW